MRTCTELLVKTDKENGCNIAAWMGKLKVYGTCQRLYSWSGLDTLLYPQLLTALAGLAFLPAIAIGPVCLTM